MTEKKSLPIGVIDSGVGGLTVLRRLRERMPQESFIYVGDTARAPYGTRSREEIALFTGEIIDYLNKRGIKELVIACNTMTALSDILSEFAVSRKWDFPIVGMSKGVNRVLSVTKNKRVGVFATDFTISTSMHKKSLQAADENVEVFGVPCTGFVPLIEGDSFGSPELDGVIKEYVQELKKDAVDTVILGCTHYPFLMDELTDALGPKVKIVDPAEATAEDAEKMLQKNQLLSSKVEPDAENACEICFTSNMERGKKLAARVLATEDCVFREISVF